MNKISSHNILLAGDSFSHCREQVQRYFKQTTLVRYDSIEVDEMRSLSGLDGLFFQNIRKAENNNRQIVQELLDELVKAKVQKITDLAAVEQGYITKTLHILTHFLDGFIGIDSHFYNLLDDSHWLTESTDLLIRQTPSQYWLLHLDCFATTLEEAGLLRG